ncbi:hypothetical protein [Bacillus cereus]|uniref:hypothetical protein n=1 Tax=Bacillus cereus TaxID=1396 RepID=UPI0018F367E4|nr:hypothetical protein [Bacillus cereus]MBJ8023703.1 hypothetical protein [Bacillus cereus]
MANEISRVSTRCIESGTTRIDAVMFDDGETLLEITDERDNNSEAIVMNTETLKELLGGIINGK